MKLPPVFRITECWKVPIDHSSPLVEPLGKPKAGKGLGPVTQQVSDQVQTWTWYHPVVVLTLKTLAAGCLQVPLFLLGQDKESNDWDPVQYSVLASRINSVSFCFIMWSARWTRQTSTFWGSWFEMALKFTQEPISFSRDTCKWKGNAFPIWLDVTVFSWPSLLSPYLAQNALQSTIVVIL